MPGKAGVSVAGSGVVAIRVSVGIIDAAVGDSIIASWTVVDDATGKARLVIVSEGVIPAIDGELDLRKKKNSPVMTAKITAARMMYRTEDERCASIGITFVGRGPVGMAVQAAAAPSSITGGWAGVGLRTGRFRSGTGAGKTSSELCTLVFVALLGDSLGSISGFGAGFLGSDAPHTAQKREPGRDSFPQFGHIIARPIGKDVFGHTWTLSG